MTALPRRAARRLTLWPLVAALYFMVSGGPYGLEELARKVGFAGAIVVIVLVPVVWSVPTALMVGELSAALPEEGGYYAWVRRALGPFWGYQEAWLSLAASVFDMAIYPTLFVLYLGRLSPTLLGASPLVVGVLVIAAGVACNLAGAWAVGEGSLGMSCVMLAPFLVLAVLGALAHPGAAASSPPAPATDVAGAALIAMWNTMGWDNASTVAGEVARPQRTYPLAVLAAVGLVVLSYVVPLAAMLHAGVDPSAWDTGAWVEAARSLGGQPLAVAVVVGGMVSAFGIFNALCMSYSRVPATMAEDGLLPKFFAWRRRPGGPPWVSVLACALAWTLSLGLSFERLVSLDILLYGTSLVLEFVALVVLRVREPSLPRPFRIPGGTVVAAAIGLGPLALLAFALVKTAAETVGPVSALLFGGSVMLLGPVAYAATRAAGRVTGR